MHVDRIQMATAVAMIVVGAPWAYWLGARVADHLHPPTAPAASIPAGAGQLGGTSPSPAPRQRRPRPVGSATPRPSTPATATSITPSPASVPSMFGLPTPTVAPDIIPSPTPSETPAPSLEPFVVPTAETSAPTETVSPTG